MSPHKQAQAIYSIIYRDPARIAEKQAEHAALADAVTSVNGSMQITSSQVNGQGFTAKPGASAQERFQVLSILMGMLAAGSAGTRPVIRKFY
jgi:hypothetical protein